MMGFVFLLKFALKCLEILAWPVFGLGYPLCASIQAIETNSNSDTQKLISYWVSISVVLLFEHSFQLECWLAFWPYIKLMIVGCLVLPYFEGSLYAYKHLVNPCLSMSPGIITFQFNKQEELFFKKDDFLVEEKRFMKENGSDSLEDLIASTKKSAKPNVAAKEIMAVAAEDRPKFEQSKLPVRFKDSNAGKTTEEIEVASTKQLEQPQLPVRFKDSNAEEITEKKEVASTKQHLQVREIESNISQTENRTFPPLESINTATTTVGGGDLFEMLLPEKVQKVWTCVICQVTAQSETALNSHLRGNRHKAVCEQLKLKNRTDVNSHLQGKRHKKDCELLSSKNQASNSNVSPASVGKNANFPESKLDKCTINNSTRPERRIRKAKQQENLMKSQCVEMIGSKWWCTICNVTSERGMRCHLNGKRHLATLRALDGLGGSGHA